MRRACSLLILLSVVAHPVFSAIRPSFNRDYSSWHATHIVLVITTPTEGTFQVVESWKGDLRTGEQLVIADLRPDSNSIPISDYPKSWETAVRGGVSELIPREPAGARMVLFLKSAEDERAPNPSLETERQWASSDLMGDMKASAVWIDQEELYGFGQLSNPGPSILFKLPYSVETLQSRVKQIAGIQKNIAAVLASQNGGERAEGLEPYVRSDVFPAQLLTLKELGKCGPAGVGVIRKMLDDPAYADEAPELIKSLAEAGGAAVGEELNTRLRRDLAFWRLRGPSLSKGWWNEDTSIHAPLRDRYGQTYQLIVALELTRYSAAMSTASELRDFWRSLPQQNDPSGLDQIALECDKLIGQLRSNQSHN